MARNDYIAQRDAIRKEFFLAGMELEGQRTVDMLCLVLHDPEIMGKDTFSGARIVKDSDCTEENFNRIVLDWLREPDKYREMGAKLAEIAIPDASRRILNMIGNIVFVARAV